VYDELLGGCGEVCSRSGLPHPHAFRPRRTRLPPAAPKSSGPSAWSYPRSWSDPRVSAFIRGSFRRLLLPLSAASACIRGSFSRYARRPSSPICGPFCMTRR